MTQLSDLDTAAQNLFQELNRATGGKAEAQASMFALGETIGLDREASERAAEDLISHGLAEIRTLSGGIGLSEEGATLMASEDKSAPLKRLGTASPLNTSQREMVEDVLTQLKSELGGSGLAYDTLSEMVADIRSVDAQLTSPKAKTTIIRACFESLLQTARGCGQNSWQRLLEDFLG